MSDKEEVVTRLQRVNYRLQSCLTQRTRLDEEIASLQKKRQFLMSLAGSGETSDHHPDAVAALAASPTGQFEVSTSRFSPQVIGPQYRPKRRISADELLRRAQTGVEQLQGATQEMAKATQSIDTTLDIVKNVINLITPEGRRQLSQIAQGLFGALSGVAVPREAVFTTSAGGGNRSGQPQQGDGGPAQSPDILGLLAYVTSPGFFDLLASFARPQQTTESSASSGN